MGQKKNIAIYCRVSTQMQTTDRQQEELTKLANERSDWNYSNGYSTVDICSLFNSEGVLAPYTKRIENYKELRAKKGLEPKEYKYIDIDNLKWRTSSLLRILRNKLYIGSRHEQRER